MKKVMFLLTALLIGGMMLTGCKKDNTDPTSKTYKISYALENTSAAGLTTADCFKFDVTYTGADGNQVEVKGVTLPWSIAAFDVKSPFTAKVEAKPVYNEDELPEVFVYGANAVIYRDAKVVKRYDDIYKSTKVKFLRTVQESPEELVIKTEYAF